MGGLFGGQGAGAQGLPPMSGFDANAVAKALAQSGVGNNAQSGVRPGVPQGSMQNPLAQMLAAQGPTYKPSDTTWGIAGDRMLRYTPQEGLKGQAGGGGGGGGAGGGGGGLPPINAGEDSTAYMLRIGMSQADADAALAMSKANPGMSFQDIVAKLHSGGAGATQGPPTGVNVPSGVDASIDWSKVGAKLDANGTPVPLPAPNPTGAPAINAAMENLKTQPLSGKTPITPLDYKAPRPSADVLLARENAARAYARQVQQERPERSASKAAKDAWVQKLFAAQADAVQASKDTGMSAGADPWLK